MSVVIVGGNECMTRQYKDLCFEYCCKAKVYTKMTARLKALLNSYLIVLSTSTVSHKMVKHALKGADTKITKIAFKFYGCAPRDT